MDYCATILLAISYLCFGSASAQTLQEVNLTQIPVADRTYDFSSDSRCRLLGHDSCILNNSQHHLLIVSEGFGTSQTLLNGEAVSVGDLNGFTAAFDLSRNFSTSNLEPLWTHKKDPNGPERRTVVNHGGIWVSKNQNKIWAQGGHFYHGERWLDSQYHVSKLNIPDWELWEFDVTDPSAGWKNITNDLEGHDNADRTFAGAAACVSGQCVWLGGVLDSTTSSNTPNGTIETTSQMLVFDENSTRLSRQEYYSQDSNEGYFQGTLIPMNLGGRDYLVSLMSLKHAVASPWTDPDGESGNAEVATPVELNSIPIYDVTEGVWFEQRTAWLMEAPQPRTRFCAALFRSEDNQTWDIWVHGGQQLDDQTSGVPEIYVLSMPSFIWSKVETTLPTTNLIRSHTCHAVGGQLLIVGGYPTGLQVESNVTCDPEYVKVLDIGEDSVAWTGAYRTNTVYRTPRVIKNLVEGMSTPYYDASYPRLSEDFAKAMAQCPGSTKCVTGPQGNKTLTTSAIAAIIVGVVLLLVFIGLVFYCYKLRIKGARESMRTTDEHPPRPPQGNQSGADFENHGLSSTQFSEMSRLQRNGLEGSLPRTRTTHSV